MKQQLKLFGVLTEGTNIILLWEYSVKEPQLGLSTGPHSHESDDNVLWEDDSLKNRLGSDFWPVPFPDFRIRTDPIKTDSTAGLSAKVGRP